VALLFCVVVFGQGRDHSGSVGELSDAAEDDFGAAVVELYSSVNLDQLSGEAADVADIFQVGGEDDYAERAGHLILAEIDVVDAFTSSLDAEDFSGDAFVFADVVGGFLNGDAVGAGEEGDGEKARGQCGETAVSGMARCRASPGLTAEGSCPHMGRGGGLGDLHYLILRAWDGGGWGRAEICLVHFPE